MGASPSDASGVRVARRASRVTRDMLDGERGTFRFGFGGAEDDDDDAEDERRDGKRARAEDRAAEEIDASSLECDDEAESAIGSCSRSFCRIASHLASVAFLCWARYPSSPASFTKSSSVSAA